MQGFSSWLLITEAKRVHVSPEVLQSYEYAFRQQLQKVIRRTRNPALRAEFQKMLDCPVRDRRGKCKSFTDYILGALVKNGIQHRFDIEAALSYVAEKMLMDTGEHGEPRVTVFGGFEERPDYVTGNPLQARFMKYLQYAVNNIRKGKIPRLANTEPRPQGTLSIGLGRRRAGDPAGDVSPDEIVARRSHDVDLGELIEDIITLLRRKEAAYPIRLVDLFHSILAGQTQDQQRKSFGDRLARVGRQVIIQTIEDYARSSQNYLLLNMLERLRSGETPAPRRPAVQRPVLSDQQRDYASLLAVLDRLDRPAGSADFGKYRRRWLEYPPRDRTSGHRNRLEEVLVKMVRDGVLRATQTGKGAYIYLPGPNADKYRQGAVSV